MQQILPNLVDPTQNAINLKMLTLQSQVKNGLSWFYWIAGLSVLNSVIYLTGNSMTFAIGLGATQFVDGFTTALARQASASMVPMVHAVGITLDLFFAGLFALCGWLGRKRIVWIILLGMAFYVLDALLVLAFKDWLGAIFHGIALGGIIRGLKAMSDLTKLEKSLALGDLTAIQQLTVAQPPADPATRRKNLLRFTGLALGSVVLLFVLLLIYFQATLG